MGLILAWTAVEPCKNKAERAKALSPAERLVMDISHTGSFVTLEGPEGAGKTTQVKLLSRQLDTLGVKHIVTRDPGGTPLGKQIRRILLNPENPVEPMAELLLYQADRAQHVSEVILPALKNGTLVICDRYVDSTIAYQGFGRGIDFSIIDD